MGNALVVLHDLDEHRGVYPALQVDGDSHRIRHDHHVGEDANRSEQDVALARNDFDWAE